MPDDLRGHDCLVMAGVGLRATWPFIENGHRRDVAIGGPVAADNADTLFDLALAGHGIVRLLDTIAGPALADGRLVPVLSDCHLADRVAMIALTRPGRELVPRVAALLAFLDNGHHDRER